MEFFGHEKCDKLIWTSGESCINTNTISKQDIKRSNMNITSTSSTLGYGFTHIRTLVISCHMNWSHTDLNHIHQKTRGVY